MAKAKKKRREVDDDEMEETFEDVGDIEQARSWAIYGRSGTGKTTFASTFPKPILLLDCADKGTDSVRDVKGLKVKRIEYWEDVEDLYWYLKRNKKKFKTIVFDTVTQLQGMCLRSVVPSKDGNDRLGDWGTLSRRQWGEASAMMKEMITNFRDLDVEIVFIAQEKTTVGDDEADEEDVIVPEVGPAAMKSVAGHLNACVSIIGHTHTRTRKIKKEGKKPIDKTIYCMRIGPNPIYATKIRKPKGSLPPAFITDPTFEDVIEIIEGE